MDTFNNTILPAFQKLHPNVTVKVEAFPDTDLRQKMLTAIAGGETPDLARADIVQVPEFAEMGAFAQLDTEMSDFNTLKDKVYEGPLSSNFYKGHYYGLPLDTNTRVLIYNKDVFASAGITDPPKTFDEMKTDCDKVKALGQADTYCYAEGGTGSWSILPWIWSNGGDVTDPTYTKATGYLNGAATVGAITMLKTMLDDKTLSPGILGNGIATSDALGKGLTATILDGPWMTPIFQSQFPDLKFDMAPMPAGPGGSVSVVGGEDIVMFEASKNKPAAEEFMRFMLTEDPQIALGKVGQMPVLKSLTGNKDLPAYYSVFQTQLATAKARTPSPAWPKIDDAVTGAVLQALNGEKTPQAALDEAAATIDGLLAGKK
jgi:multiple sugar transport system substrate-binding protein